VTVTVTVTTSDNAGTIAGPHHGVVTTP